MYITRIVTVIALVVLLSHAAHSAPVSNPSKTPLLTLAAALQGSTPTEGIVIAVGAEQNALPNQTAPPQPQDTVNAIAQRFGQQTQTFGTVTAIAPKTRVVLNTHPEQPDIFGHLSADSAFQILIGSLDDTQWHALTSDQGLGLADLTDDMQKSLFYAQFPNRQLWVVSDDPGLADQPDGKRADARDLSNRIEGVRIRLGQTAHLYLNDTSGKTIYFSGQQSYDRNTFRRWFPKRTTTMKHDGIVLKAVVPNTPKPSDLRFDAPNLQVQIRLQGLHTVGELVAQIAQQCHQELYADPHYPAKILTIIGSSPSAPAGDLLQALALSVAGTYRRVGPAFVLTDDLNGVGVRRKMITEWETMTNASAQHFRDAAGQRLVKQRTQDAIRLSGFGDPLALTSDEIQAARKNTDNANLPFGMDYPYPFANLTSEQQTWAQRIAAEYETHRSEKTLPSYLAETNPGAADLTKTVLLRVQYVVQLIVPFESAPIKSSKSSLSFLFWPGEAALATGTKPPVLPKLSGKSFSALLQSRRHRAIYGHPQTVAETDALIDAMQKIGLNELYLDVCPNGMVLTSEDTAILDEALKLGPKTGIAVYTYLSLTNWGDTPPEDARDLTIRGETNREAAIQLHTENPDPKLADFDDAGQLIPFKVPETAVSFSSPWAHTALQKLITDLAQRSGLAGFVWLDAEVDSDLGYTPDQRLSFLRTAHADPWDITPETYSQIDLTLPTFDDDAVESSLRTLWDNARTATHMSLLREMRQAIALHHGNLTILMPQTAGNSDWLTNWDIIQPVPPSLRQIVSDSSFPTEADANAIAKRQGQTINLVVTTMHANPDLLASMLQDQIKNDAWNGYVLDFGVAETRGLHPLEALVQALSK